MPSQWLSRWTSISQGFVQITFFVTTGVVAILSYIRARKTLFQPLRTEVFKEQLKILTKILDQFEGKGEDALLNDWGLLEVIKLNMLSLIDTYAVCVFKQDIDLAERPYSKVHSVFWREPRPVADPGYDFWGEFSFPDSILPSNLPDPTKWDGYWHFHVYLPEKYDETRQKLKRLIDSPLVPTGCLKLLRDYTALNDWNIRHIQAALSEFALDLCEDYPTLEYVAKLAPHFYPLIYERFERLEPKAKEIIDFARVYWDPDRLFN